MPLVERFDVGPAVELEVLGSCQFGMFQHPLDQAVAEPVAAVPARDGDVEDERLERVVGDDPRVASRSRSCSASDCSCEPKRDGAA